MLLIKNGIIHDAITPEPFKADILVKDGKIAEIGVDIDAPEAEVFDAEGKDIFPGFIDAHTHIGMFGYGGDCID